MSKMTRGLTERKDYFDAQGKKKLLWWSTFLWGGDAVGGGEGLEEGDRVFWKKRRLRGEEKGDDVGDYFFCGKKRTSF